MTPPTRKNPGTSQWPGIRLVVESFVRACPGQRVPGATDALLGSVEGSRLIAREASRRREGFRVLGAASMSM